MNRFCTFLGLRLFAVKENSSESNLQLLSAVIKTARIQRQYHERTRNDDAITG